jgi:hypothetical protein
MKTYCVYLTVYRGSLLPPFYIGYSSVDKVENGYNGSVSSKTFKEAWALERKQNRHLFSTKIIKTFESSSAAREYEEKVQRHLKVHKNPLYINMSIGYSKFCMDAAFEKGIHHFQDSAFQSQVNQERLSRGNHPFQQKDFQAEMNRRAHSGGNHPFHGGKLAKELNDRRLKDGTHNLLGCGEAVKRVIVEKRSRANVQVLKELQQKTKVKLGTNWWRKSDDWIDAKIVELTQRVPCGT